MGGVGFEILGVDEVPEMFQDSQHIVFMLDFDRWHF